MAKSKKSRRSSKYDALTQRHKDLEEASAGIKDLSRDNSDIRTLQTSDVRDASDMISEDFSLDDKKKSSAAHRRRNPGRRVRTASSPRSQRKRQQTTRQARRQSPGKEVTPKIVRSRTTNNATPSQASQARAKVKVRVRSTSPTKPAHQQAPSKAKVKARATAAVPGRTSANTIHSQKLKQPAPRIKPEDVVGIDVDSDVTEDELEKMDTIMSGGEWVACPHCGAMKKRGHKCPKCGL